MKIKQGKHRRGFSRGSQNRKSRLLLSFVVPVYNEEGSLEILFEKIAAQMKKLAAYRYQIIFVDDGSQDSSWKVIQRLSQTFSTVLGISFRRNIGKASALAAGFAAASGDIIFTIDADLQDDPEDIPLFLEKLNEGFDMVSGWKKKRSDPFAKRFSSKVFNALALLFSKIKIHDFNCGFKGYRKEVAKSLKLYGELHRLTPILAKHYGYRVGEVVVKNHPRQYGVSKYGFSRFLRGLIDLMTVYATTRYLDRPGHMLGGIGFVSGLLGSIGITYLVVMKFFFGEAIGHRPLLSLSILLVILSVQLISLGVLSELIVRYNSQNISFEKFVKEKCNL